MVLCYAVTLPSPPQQSLSIVHVLTSQYDPASSSVKLVWRSTAAEEMVTCSSLLLQNIYYQSNVILKNIDIILHLVQSMTCQEIVAKSFKQEELRCEEMSHTSKYDILMQHYVTAAFCRFYNLAVCIKYTFTTGNQDCDHEFTKHIKNVYQALYKSTRQKRFRFSLFDEDISSLEADIRQLKENNFQIDSNVKNIHSSLTNLINNNEGQDIKLYVADYFKLVAEQQIITNAVLFVYNVDILQQNVRLVVSEYFTYVENILAELSDVVSRHGASVSGNMVCRQDNGEVSCTSGPPLVTCLNYTWHYSTITEKVEYIETLYYRCVPAQTESYTGLSDIDNKFLISSTSGNEYFLTHDGKLFETKITTDNYQSDKSHLLYIYSCYFNRLADDIMISCVTHTTLHYGTHIQQLQPYEMVIVHHDNFPLHINSHLVKYDDIIEQVDLKVKNQITKKDQIPIIFNYQSLPPLLDDFHRRKKEIRYKIPLLDVIHQYRSFSDFFYGSLGIISVVVIIITSCVCYKLRKYICGCCDGRCKWCSRSGTGEAADGQEMVPLGSDRPVQDQATQVVARRPRAPVPALLLVF